MHTGSENYTRDAYAALLAAHRAGGDFAGWLTQVLAAVATKVGGIDSLLAARPGSWEAAYIADWLASAGVGIADAGHDLFVSILDAAQAQPPPTDHPGDPHD